MLPLLIQDEKLEIEMKQTLDTMQLKIQLRNIANIAIEDQSMIIRSIIIVDYYYRTTSNILTSGPGVPNLWTMN